MWSFRDIFILVVLYTTMVWGCGIRSLSEGGEVSGSQAAYVVPIEYKDGLIFIEVEINGVKRRFIVDSGASTVIDRRIYNKSEFEWIKDELVRDADGRLAQVPIVKIKNLKVGSVEILNSMAGVADMSHFKCLNIDGLLGANVLAHFDLEIDFDKEELILHNNPVEESYLEKFESDFRFKENDQRIPLLNVSWEAKPFEKNMPKRWTVRNMTLDLGSGGGVSIQRYYAMTPAFYDDKTWFYGARMLTIFGASDTDTTYSLRLHSFEIGDETIGNIIAQTNSNTFNHIGTAFWDDYRLLISWRRKKVFLKKTTPLSEPEMPDRTIACYLIDGEFIITAVFENSRLQNEGLAPGDRIISVNGESMTHITDEQFCTWKDNLQGDELYQFEIETQNALRSITVRGDELLSKS